MTILTKEPYAPDQLKMQVSRIVDIHQFDQLKTDWERVYAADPHAHIFLSWTWLSGWFKITPYNWLVLALRPGQELPYLAFFPLILRGPRVFKFRPISVLHMGGHPLAAYTGFVCLPEFEETALTTLAQYIQQQLDWDSFQMNEVLDPRLELFLNNFPKEKFGIQQSNGMPSLYLTLPDTWNQYLQVYLGSGTRQSLKRRIRQVEGLDGFHVTQIKADSAERDIDLLLALWQRRWGPKPIAPWCQKIIRHFFEQNRLWLTVLWSETTPIAALVALLDQQKRTFVYYISGFNEEFARISPGRVMVARSIQAAIENGFQTFDFLTGVDSYKISFGPIQRSTNNIVITRRGLKSTIANIITRLIGRVRDLLIKVLGKTKRIELVKKIWFGLQPLTRRIRQ